jgi:hypothetical protein
MKHKNNFNRREQEQQSEQTLQQSSAMEFASVEEMLRYDAAQTVTPRRITSRLRESLGDVPQVQPPWWRKIFWRRS